MRVPSLAEPQMIFAIYRLRLPPKMPRATIVSDNITTANQPWQGLNQRTPRQPSSGERPSEYRAWPGTLERRYHTDTQRGEERMQPVSVLRGRAGGDIHNNNGHRHDRGAEVTAASDCARARSRIARNRAGARCGVVNSRNDGLTNPTPQPEPHARRSARR